MSESRSPLISVIVPVYNRERYVAEAIDSILAQDYRPLEIIVVDDGSTDRTPEIVQSYGDKLIYLCQENQGVSAARNSGVDYAHGEFLAFLDSDDTWVANKLSMQMSILEDSPDLDIVYGHSEQFFSPEVDESFKRKTRIPQKIMAAQISCSMLVRASSFKAVGPYDAAFRAGCDIDWYARSQELGLKNHMMSEVVNRRRVHPANATAYNEDANLSRLRTLKAALDRRRAAGFVAER